MSWLGPCCGHGHDSCNSPVLFCRSGVFVKFGKISTIFSVLAANFVSCNLCRVRVVLIGSEGVEVVVVVVFTANFLRLDLLSTIFLLCRDSSVPLNPISYLESELLLS